MLNPRTRNGLILAGSILFLLAAIVVLSDGKTEAEALKEQLRAKGEKISFTELGLTNSQKGAHISRLTAVGDQLKTSYLVPGSFQMMRMVAPQKAVVAWQNNILPAVPAARRNPSPPVTNTWDDFTRELDRFKDEFTFLHSLLENPPAQFGHDYRDMINFPKFTFIAERTAAQWLMGATLSELHFGRRAEALQHLHTLMAMVHLHKDDTWLVNQMIRLAIGGLALSATWEMLQTEGWTDAELAHLQGAWEQIYFPEIVEKGLIGERAMVDVCFELVRTNRSALLKATRVATPSLPGKIASHVGVSLWGITSSQKDELFALTMSQQSIELARQLGSRPWPMIEKDLDAWQIEFEKRLASFTKYRHWLSSVIIPNASRCLQAAVRNEAMRSLAVTAIALKRYQLRHGQWPSHLSQVTPEFLAAPPRDCMSGETLLYRLNSDGTFTLYSVGENGQDDQGTGSATSWLEGPDVVWPHPATPGEIEADIRQRLLSPGAAPAASPKTN